jgi:hypothetical protein
MLNVPMHEFGSEVQVGQASRLSSPFGHIAPIEKSVGAFSYGDRQAFAGAGFKPALAQLYKRGRVSNPPLRRILLLMTLGGFGIDHPARS